VSYILPESPVAETYLQIHRESEEREKNFDTNIHDFAANGKLTNLIDFIESKFQRQEWMDSEYK
jgi:hypothetical protein